MDKRSQTLVLGIGNDILMDDGIGSYLVSRLQRADALPGVDYKTAFLGGLDLLDLVKDYNSMILIDSIKTKKGVAGSVYSFTPDNFKETQHLSNIHDTSFLTALKLGRHIGITLPEKIDIIAIEVVEDRCFGTSFSPPIKEKTEKIYQIVLQKIYAILAL